MEISGQEVRYRCRKPKEAFLDLAQRSYLTLKSLYGVNYVITSKALQEQMGCAESTFNDNFCGGVNGFLSLSERIVAERFAEAVMNTESGLSARLAAGLRALYMVDPHSKYNLFQNTNFDMNLRTRFAAEAFSSEYWERVIEPLYPDIDAYLTENTERWRNATENVKAYAYKLFAGSFRWAMQMLTEEDISQLSIMEQSKRLKDYSVMIEKMLLSQARALMEDRYHFETEIVRIAGRIAENGK